MKRFSDFIDFSGQDLAADESFQAYVFRKNEEDILFWEQFISAHPEKLHNVEEATEVLSLLTFKKNIAPAESREAELNRLLSSLSRPEKQVSVLQKEREMETRLRPSFLREIFENRTLRIAASWTCLLILFGATLYLVSPLWEDRTVTYVTSYGENATYTLPDGSVVILNGNTRLILDEDWDPDSPREVWLEGEAFFDVKHKSDSEDGRFVVHTPGMDVEVLGTEFNVFNREDKTNVVLNSGKVKLKIGSNRDTSSVIMMPDEAVEFLRKDHTVTKKQVKAEVLTSWRNKVLVFENTPLHEVGELIEYTYGVKVNFNSDVDSSESLAGTIPNENLEVLLTVLAKSSNLRITRKKDQIFIEKKDPVSRQH